MLLILKIQLNGFGDLQKIGADTAAIRAKFCHVKIRPEVGQIWSNSIQPRAKREEAPGQASGAPEGEEGLQARLDRGPPIGKKVAVPSHQIGKHRKLEIPCFYVLHHQFLTIRLAGWIARENVFFLAISAHSKLSNESSTLSVGFLLA